MDRWALSLDLRSRNNINNENDKSLRPSSSAEDDDYVINHAFTGLLTGRHTWPKSTSCVRDDTASSERRSGVRKEM
ncbi:hypothetical protein TNCV_796941 [Trichonephila clavipes]|uniref:Uncharacterized protein n=1 Tax=Trichonephila clavipes TaxID=2585209 RepID=A0A8X7BM17_TRICX|nr:hypothetical protein TNCV_796941 [Trichonephila clavipes]